MNNLPVLQYLIVKKELKLKILSDINDWIDEIVEFIKVELRRTYFRPQKTAFLYSTARVHRRLRVCIRQDSLKRQPSGPKVYNRKSPSVTHRNKKMFRTWSFKLQPMEAN